MSRPLITYLLGIVTVLSLWGVWRVVERSKRIVPPWHPFELRSDLTLDDLVADGYRVSDMPCGMIHFSKTVGDTTIRYWVNIGPKEYRGKHVAPEIHDLTILEEDIVFIEENPEDVPTVFDSTEKTVFTWQAEVDRDPYWPIDREEARKGYQHIYWRHYWFTMETIDSMAIKYFAERYGCFTYDEQWNCSEGGTLKVSNPLNKLSFHCVIDKVDPYDSTNSTWQFRMIDHIPFLDQARYEKHLEWERKRRRYFEEE